MRMKQRQNSYGVELYASCAHRCVIWDLQKSSQSHKFSNTIAQLLLAHVNRTILESGHPQKLEFPGVWRRRVYDSGLRCSGSRVYVSGRRVHSSGSGVEKRGHTLYAWILGGAVWHTPAAPPPFTARSALLQNRVAHGIDLRDPGLDRTASHESAASPGTCPSFKLCA